MKKEFSTFIWVALLSFLHMSCDKDSMEATMETPPPTVSRPSIPPQANAGLDIWVDFPLDSVVLTGTNGVFSTNPHRYLWKQVRGPNISLIADKDSSITRISKLIEGTYEFEFTVTDAMGFDDKDSILIFVQDFSFSGSKVVTFNGVSWTCPMGCSLIINCLSCHIPIDKPFKVYVKEIITAPWTEAVTIAQWSPSTQYIYEIDGNKLILYTNYESAGKADIKIVY